VVQSTDLPVALGPEVFLDGFESGNAPGGLPDVSDHLRPTARYDQSTSSPQLEDCPMPPRRPRIDETRALRHLMELLAIEGLSGRERDVADAVEARLLAAGCSPRWIRHDRAHEEIGEGWEVGNLIVRIPGSVRGERRLFMGHLDTVPLCRGAVPVRKGRRIISQGETALGGDNRTSIGCLMTMIETLLERELPHPPLTVLMTVGEEVGLKGARHVAVEDLGKPTMGFNIDGGAPADIVIGAIGGDRWQVDVWGKSSHAGVHPEEGVSATLIAARAIADVAEKGYFGKVAVGRRTGTSNVGAIHGGETTNQVTDHVLVKGESRSHDRRFLARITETYRRAFERAARSVRSADGASGRIDFRSVRDYDAYRMRSSEPVVKLAQETARELGLEPRLLTVDGGVDASYLNAKGVPTVTLGAGQHKPHTVDEYVEVREYLDACRYVLALATA
jgi:tripeptide aminopeptidase